MLDINRESIDVGGPTMIPAWSHLVLIVHNISNLRRRVGVECSNLFVRPIQVPTKHGVESFHGTIYETLAYGDVMVNSFQRDGNASLFHTPNCMPESHLPIIGASNLRFSPHN